MEHLSCPDCGQPCSPESADAPFVMCAGCGGLIVLFPDRPADTTEKGSGPAATPIVALPSSFTRRYTLEDRLGAGGMGLVLKARDRLFNRPVAIKFLTADGAPALALRRFWREAKLLAAIHHPNVVEVYDLNEVGGCHYLVCEYLARGTLRQRLCRSRPGADESVAIICDCLAGLQACHDAGIVHRDVKPENILFDETDRAKIADLGIARSDGQDTRLTATGAIVGTPMYMAPEQILGEAVSPATDLYSLGLVLYEMLSGRLPFDSTNPLAFLYLHTDVPPRPIRDLVPHVPAGLADLLDRTLAKKPGDRPASARELADGLRQGLHATVPLRAGPVDGRPGTDGDGSPEIPLESNGRPWPDAASARGPARSSVGRAFVAVLASAVALVAAATVWYHGLFVGLEEENRRLWAQVETQMGRRADLVPRLLRLFEGRAGSDRSTLNEVARAHREYLGATSIPARSRADATLRRELARAREVLERQPGVATDAEVQQTIDELTAVQNRISIERMRYDEGVSRFNTAIRRFPARLFAAALGFHPQDLPATSGEPR